MWTQGLVLTHKSKRFSLDLFARVYGILMQCIASPRLNRPTAQPHIAVRKCLSFFRVANVHTFLPVLLPLWLFSGMEKGSAIGNLWSRFLAYHMVVHFSILQRSGLGTSSLGRLISMAGSFLFYGVFPVLYIFCGMLKLKAPLCWLYQLYRL